MDFNYFSTSVHALGSLLVSLFSVLRWNYGVSFPSLSLCPSLIFFCPSLSLQVSFFEEPRPAVVAEWDNLFTRPRRRASNHLSSILSKYSQAPCHGEYGAGFPINLFSGGRPSKKSFSYKIRSTSPPPLVLFEISGKW